MSTPPPIYSAPNAPVEEPRRPVPTYLAWSIIGTVLSLCLCCIIGTIPGIVAIVFSTQVNSALNRGDYVAAQRASSNARLWCWITTALNILGLLWVSYVVATGQWGDMMEQFEAMQAMQGV
ncbi:CD225/dispanin family protein [Lysobacter sp. N42]|uniref:CD225/dispanin family protein n=1 Tax=Lysobacter sp. N42 TaxID=2545719 RepID=UPI00104FC10E|nr:CD225/dispanin family protein [Lysobacter sp. N42]TCZ85020.1 CD225/dispanin family protein [Lysobacter sp. N42]